MIYIKKNFSTDLEVKIDVYEDEFYTVCPKCGKEIHLDFEMLKDLVNSDCDFAGTNIICENCANENQEVKDISLKLIESQNKNSDILYDLINQIKDKKFQDELFTAIDTYNQLVFNDFNDDC